MMSISQTAMVSASLSLIHHPTRRAPRKRISDKKTSEPSRHVRVHSVRSFNRSFFYYPTSHARRFSKSPGRQPFPFNRVRLFLFLPIPLFKKGDHRPEKPVVVRVPY